MRSRILQNLFISLGCMTFILLFMIKTMDPVFFQPRKEAAQKTPVSSNAPHLEEIPEEIPSSQESEADSPLPDPPLPEKQTPKIFTTCDSSYFDDALFIGDSRTVGLSEYGFLDTADFFAESGMSVYKLEELTFSVQGTKYTLHELLTAKQYGKIYLMLGINELGYSLDTTIQRYGELVDTLKTLQPNAIIYICANLHVTKERSDSSDLYNNTNINYLNQGFSQYADQIQTFYIDVNELFDDANGNLNADYTADNAHVLGKYYQDWCRWLCTKAIQ